MPLLRGMYAPLPGEDTFAQRPSWPSAIDCTVSPPLDNLKTTEYTERTEYADGETLLFHVFRIQNDCREQDSIRLRRSPFG